MFLKTVGPDEATGEVAEIYQAEIARIGFLMEATACWTTRPEVLPLFEQFSEGVKANFSLGMRGWRLITFIAAKQAPSTYCTHVYARSLIKELGSKAQVLALQRDFRRAGLSDKEVAMLAFAEQVARDASKTTQGHIDALREVGFSDVEISDIALCASIRSFVSRFFDATGATPEPVFFDDDLEFREAMTVGKAI
ncbi:carboxymuconolactone decarboxylase family protein [Devosia lacusdianchii]|uniref:carboxymuconolactone decarboxylase family protein n=1 Tax=Devosia lacusdianchii TaxID=2917991 RepID=UPI001F06649A|nr:alkylhydroperoxidase [Devosia sp. JXJ CY 41]